MKQPPYFLKYERCANALEFRQGDKCLRHIRARDYLSMHYFHLEWWEKFAMYVDASLQSEDL